eukprot:GSA25T00016355001.1
MVTVAGAFSKYPPTQTPSSLMSSSSPAPATTAGATAPPTLASPVPPVSHQTSSTMVLAP